MWKFLKRGESEDRYRAADVLGGMKPPPVAAVPRLIASLRDRDLYVRSSAAMALANMGPPAAAASPALARALKDQEPGVRLFAADALAQMGSAGVSGVPALLSLGGDRDEGTRLLAVKSLEAIAASAERDAPSLSSRQQATALRLWKEAQRHLSGRRSGKKDEAEALLALQKRLESLLNALQSAK